MNFNKYTIKAQEAIQKSGDIAKDNHHQAIEGVHLFLTLLNEDESVIPYLIKKVGVNPDYINQKCEDLLQKYPKVEGATGGQYLSNDLYKILEIADKNAGKYGDEFISTEHLLLAMVQSNDKIGEMLKAQGIKEKHIEEAIKELRGNSRVTDQNAEANYQSLKKYTIDLTKRAAAGKMDPVIGRDEEIRRVLHILSRRTKNNPILVGEPGVGKTAIAEGIALRIAQGDVPETLKSKKLLSLDLGGLLAGAKYRGEFEERLKSVVKEIQQANGGFIVFIDEIHTLVGAGKTDGAMDAANILKPALARGELRAVGATTLAEYQKYIEKDKALERRFQTVLVDEPNSEDAISILRGLKEKYEVHHGVKINDNAIVSAVEFSQRYISDRFLPDKAIDLIDEAAAKLRLEIDSMPAELDEIERKIRQLEIEKAAVERDNDERTLEEIEGKIANLSEERDALKAHWQSEKEIIQQIRDIKEQIDQFKIEAEKAERNADYGKVAELRYGKIAEAEKTLEQKTIELQALQKDKTMLSEEVTSNDIAEIISKWTGIPVSKMLESEREKLLMMEHELHKRVIGQETAISAIANAVRRSRAGLQDPNRPIGSFIFLGPTGVGKTELAKSLAEYLFNDDAAMVRIDMSEFQERHAVSRLIGAPPGYVGYDEGGQLTEAVRRKPYSVILLDEIEKAHPDVFNILLQVLDDGRLTDNKGRTVNFKNTIIIMTSNMGAHIIQEKLGNLSPENRDELMDEVRVKVLDLLKKTIRPEFLNRIDETIMFTPLSKEEIRNIVEIQVYRLKTMLADREIELNVSNAAMDLLGELGYDPQFGARPLKRIIQQYLINELSKNILKGEIRKDSVINIDENAGSLVFKNE